MDLHDFTSETLRMSGEKCQTYKQLRSIGCLESKDESR